MPRVSFALPRTMDGRESTSSANEWRRRSLRLILLIGDVLHPFDDSAVERFLDGDVSHGGVRRRAVPMLFAGRKPHDIAGMNLLDRAAPPLRAARAGSDDQS